MKNYLDSIDRAALRSRAEQMLHTAGETPVIRQDAL